MRQGVRQGEGKVTREVDGEAGRELISLYQLTYFHNLMEVIFIFFI